MPVTLRDFLNVAKSLSFIDKQPWMTDIMWSNFSRDPVGYFLCTDEDMQRLIWEQIDARYRAETQGGGR